MFPQHLILFLVAGILFLVSGISYLQGYKFCCDRLFLCLVYCAVLITFYFTYSVRVAKKMITKQIKLTVSDMNSIQKNFNISKKKLPSSQSTQNNLDTKIKNKKIWNQAKILIGICLVLSFTLSGALWIYKNQHHKFFNFQKYTKEIFIKNIIILLAVVLVQFVFSTIFIGNILPLDSQDIIKTVVEGSLNS